MNGKHIKTAQRGRQSNPKQKIDGDTCTLDQLHGLPRELIEEIFKLCQKHMWQVIKMNVTTTGLSEGDFHRLAVLHNGSLTDIISLIGSSGGVRVNSATTPLNINNNVLSIDLAAYATSSAVNASLANYRLTSQLFDNVTAGAGLALVKSCENGPAGPARKLQARSGFCVVLPHLCFSLYI